MSVWDVYKTRVEANGSTLREAKLRAETRYLSTKAPDSLSHFAVEIDGVSREVSILNTDNFNQKKVCSLPGEDLTPGGLVEWRGSKWLITEKDAADEVYARALMEQCNYLLKWVDEDGVIREQWCIVSDASEVSDGERTGGHVITVGDSKLLLTIAKNEYTVLFRRGLRFLIDDPDDACKLAYELTKPLKVGKVYGSDGVFSFVLQECNSTDADNHELGVADYYKHFADNRQDPSPQPPIINPEETTTDDGKRVWL